MYSAFNNMSVRAKLIAAFACVLVTTLGLGLFSVQRLSAVNDVGHELKVDSLPSMVILGKLRYDAMGVVREQGHYLLEPDEKGRIEQEGDIKGYMDGVDADFAAYRPFITPGEEAQTFARLERDWKTYVDVQAKVHEILKTQGQAAAFAVSKRLADPAFESFLAGMAAEVKMAESAADQQSRGGQTAFESARVWIFVALGLAALVCMAAGFVLTRAISGPVRQMAGVMGALGDGDMSVEVPNADRKDEIGILAKAILAFKDQLATIERVFMPNVMVAAVRTSSIPVMTIDRNFNVTFVNDATKKLFRDNIVDFRTLSPSIDPDRLVGTCIDVFHKDPSHKRQMLSDPSRLPHDAEVTIGGLKISLHISAVVDAKGCYLGNVMEWNDVTEARLNEGRLNALQVSQAIIEFTPEGAILDANKNFLSVMGRN